MARPQCWQNASIELPTNLRLVLASLRDYVTSMCGRYTHKLTWQQIVNLYRLTLPEEEPPGFRQSYNVAPTDVMPIIRPSGNGRELVMAGWGLDPFWLKPDQLAKQPYSTINARAETIQMAASYREPFQKRRCLVPASGWYEWQKLDEKGKKKRPYHFKPKSEPFALAGVYDIWRGDGGRAITSFAIVTTDAAASVKQYHHRMPVVLDDSQFDDWMRHARSGSEDDEALHWRDRRMGSGLRRRQCAEQSA